MRPMALHQNLFSSHWSQHYCILIINFATLKISITLLCLHTSKIVHVTYMYTYTLQPPTHTHSALIQKMLDQERESAQGSPPGQVDDDVLNLRPEPEPKHSGCCGGNG